MKNIKKDIHMSKKTSNKNIVIIAVAALAILIVVGLILFLGREKKVVINPENMPEATIDENIEGNSTASSEIDLAVMLTDLKNQFSTITETKIFTEENDPNTNSLGKPGQYMSGVAWQDSRTGWTPESESDPNRWGTSAGGSIEVFETEAEAKTRNEYIAAFDGSFLSPGMHKQIGKVVVRISDDLPKSQQDELMTFIESQF